MQKRIAARAYRFPYANSQFDLSYAVADDLDPPSDTAGADEQASFGVMSLICSTKIGNEDTTCTHPHDDVTWIMSPPEGIRRGDWHAHLSDRLRPAFRNGIRPTK